MLKNKHLVFLCLVPITLALAYNIQQLTEECQKSIGWDGFKKQNVFEVSTRSFYYNATETKWVEAGDWCQQRGMLQPMLKTTSELEKVNKELQSRGFSYKGFWLAASDVGRTPGQFLWSDETPVDAALWGAGQPDHFGVELETCVFFGTNNNAKLRDWRCWYTAKILCELPESVKSCL